MQAVLESLSGSRGRERAERVAVNVLCYRANVRTNCEAAARDFSCPSHSANPDAATIEESPWEWESCSSGFAFRGNSGDTRADTHVAKIDASADGRGGGYGADIRVSTLWALSSKRSPQQLRNPHVLMSLWASTEQFAVWGQAAGHCNGQFDKAGP
jgi:hypothetical protein